MKPAVDEMFPEGAGPYVDLDEVRRAAAGVPGPSRAPSPGSPLRDGGRRPGPRGAREGASGTGRGCAVAGAVPPGASRRVVCGREPGTARRELGGGAAWRHVTCPGAGAGLLGVT